MLRLTVCWLPVSPQRCTDITGGEALDGSLDLETCTDIEVSTVENVANQTRAMPRRSK